MAGDGEQQLQRPEVGDPVGEGGGGTGVSLLIKSPYDLIGAESLVGQGGRAKNRGMAIFPQTSAPLSAPGTAPLPSPDGRRPDAGTRPDGPSPAGAQPRLPALRHIGPNWYASVMGTAIVAAAGAALPVDVPGLRTACTVVWALSALLLAAVLAARAGHWIHHRDQARTHLLDPAVAPSTDASPWRCWRSAGRR